MSHMVNALLVQCTVTGDNGRSIRGQTGRERKKLLNLILELPVTPS